MFCLYYKPEKDQLILFNKHIIELAAALHSFDRMCSFRKYWYSCHRTEKELEYFEGWGWGWGTNYATKLKAEFSYCDQAKFNEPVLKPAAPE